MKDNKELIKEANVLAEQHAFKKGVIENLLSNLDAKSKFSDDHINGMAAVQELMKEMEDLELRHEEIRKQIKT